MEEVKVSINKTSFPNSIIPDSEKNTTSFGLRIGQAIQYEWFKGASGDCRFYNRQASFLNRRVYARGEQSVAKYKSELAIDGDLSHTNLDWTPVPIIPKFVDIVVNGMSERLFSIKAFSTDAVSVAKRSKYQNSLRADMASKDILTNINAEFNVNSFDTDPKDLPETDDELDIHMQLKYKPAIEIAEEVAISTILNENHFSDIKKRVDYDIATLGIGVTKHSFVKGRGIAVEYVNPIDVVYSYTEDPFFKDCFYWGEVKNIHIDEVRKIDPEITNEDLKLISEYGTQWDTYTGRADQNSLFKNEMVTILYFNYKTSNSTIHKKKITSSGTDRVIEKDDSFNPPEDVMEERGFEKIVSYDDVWYDGAMVMGSNILLKWELSKNMVRPNSASQGVMSNYVAAAPRMLNDKIDSLTRRMESFADLIQLTHLKLQLVIQRTVPDGVFIDADGLSEIDLGNGQAYNPGEALKLFFQTGSVIGRSTTQDGEFNHAKVPIEVLNNGTASNKIRSLIDSYNHYLGMIRDVTGLNEARDGSSPDPKALVGVQKLAALNSNTATRHILDASLYITRTTAEALSLRLSDVLEYAESRDELINQIGAYNVRILDDIKELYLHDFGIFIEVSPDAEQAALLEANIQVALTRESIDLDDAIDIREIKNIKMANQLLKIRKKRKIEEDRKFKMLEQQQVQKGQMAIQEAARRTALEKAAAEAKGKMDLATLNGQIAAKNMMLEASEKKKLMQTEFDFNMQLKTADVASVQEREDNKELAKDKRVDKQSTQQSKMIDQRNKDLPPIDFESNEDTLDGFDFSSFEPR